MFRYGWPCRSRESRHLRFERWMNLPNNASISLIPKICIFIVIAFLSSTGKHKWSVRVFDSRWSPASVSSPKSEVALPGALVWGIRLFHLAWQVGRKMLPQVLTSISQQCVSGSPVPLECVAWLDAPRSSSWILVINRKSFKSYGVKFRRPIFIWIPASKSINRWI